MRREWWPPSAALSCWHVWRLVALLGLVGGVAPGASKPLCAGAIPRGTGLCAFAAATGLLRIRGGSCYSSREPQDSEDDLLKEPQEYARRILVTGGCGFMGSYLVDRLVSRYEDYLIVVLDVLDECGSLEHLRGALGQPNCIFVRGDIRDEQTVAGVLKDYAVDTVLHLAAQTSVDHSFKDPAVFAQVNVIGTQRMLECCRKSPSLRLFLHCSTDEVCGEVGGDAAVTEDCPMRPTNPYSASKAAAELLVQGYMKSFQLPCIVTRCVNVYGGRQFPEKVIPKFIMRCRRGEPCCVHGDGQARRSFIFVEDVAEAFDLIVHQGKVGNIYNIGSRDCVSVREIADSICAATGQPGNIETVRDRLYNDCRYALDCSKLETLGWRQKTSFAEGLQRCLEWYEKDDGRSWEPQACEHALLPHSYIDGDGLTSGVRFVNEDDELDDALRSAGVF